jgi:hypothetical protein
MGRRSVENTNALDIVDGANEDKDQGLHAETDAMYEVETHKGPLRSKRKQSEQRSLRPVGDGQFAQLGFVMSPAALQAPVDVTIEMVYAIADTLFNVENSLQIWIGDLLATAEELEYGAISRLAEKFNREPKTLWNWKHTCSSVQTSLRREVFQEVQTTTDDYKILSMTHYKLLAVLEPDDQRYYMHEAMANRWSVAALRKAISSANQPVLPEESAILVRRQIIQPAQSKLNRALESVVNAPSNDNIEAAIKELEELRALLNEMQKDE